MEGMCLKMGLSEETLIINFLINALRRKNQLKKTLIEYQFPNTNQENVKPDLLVYIVNNSDPLCYIIFEYKKRTVTDDIGEIQNQYLKYCHVNQNCFDPLVIPCPSNSLPMVFLHSLNLRLL